MKKRKQLFSFVFTIFFCVTAFALMTFFSLFEKTLPTGDSATAVPRQSSFSGENILFSLPFDSAFFSISEDEIRIYLLSFGESPEILADFGYEITKTVNCDYSALGRLIDSLGGIEMTENGETLCLAGVQVADILSRGAKNGKRREITEKIFKKISDGNFGTQQLNFLLENTETNLSFPDGYNLLSVLPQSAKNLNFINQEE